MFLKGRTTGQCQFAASSANRQKYVRLKTLYILNELNTRYKDTRILGSLFASGIKIYIRICLGDVPFTRKQYITNASLVINNSNINYEHVIQLTQARTYPSAPTHS